MRPALITRAAAALLLMLAPSALAYKEYERTTLLELPKSILQGVGFDTMITLPPLVNGTADWLMQGYVDWRVYEGDSQELLAEGRHNTTNTDKGTAEMWFMVEDLEISGYGDHYLQFEFDLAGDKEPVVDRIDAFVIPQILCLFPTIITLVIAVYTKQAVLALLGGIWTGCFFMAKYNPLRAFLMSWDEYFTKAITDDGHEEVLLFTCVLGGVIAIVQKSGGSMGLARAASKYAKTRKQGLLIAWLLGFVVFFDDYAAILIVGKTFAPMMDVLHMSPEKLSFIVQVVGSCLPSMFPVSSWVGVELGYISGQYTRLNIDQDAFIVLMRGLPYRFFPLCMIIWCLIIIVMDRDFGQMWEPERAAVMAPDPPMKELTDSSSNGGSSDESILFDDGDTPLLGINTQRGQQGSIQQSDGAPAYVDHTAPLDDVEGFGGDGSSSSKQASGLGGSDVDSVDRIEEDEEPKEELGPLDPDPNKPMRALNALIPFGFTIVAGFVGMYITGVEAINDLPPDERVEITLINAFSYSSSARALIWTSSLASILAFAMVSGPWQRLLTIDESVTAWIIGFRDMIEPMLVLLLAWALGDVIVEVQTAEFLSGALSDSLPSAAIPILATVMTFLVSFAMGNSLGAAGIVFPLALPLAYSLSGEDETMVMQTSAGILSAATFGSTSSPISGNTVLTAMCTNCSMNAHVKTTMLYACIVAAITLIFGTIPVAAGVYPSYVALGICTGCMVFVVWFFGRRTDCDDHVPKWRIVWNKIQRMRGREPAPLPGVHYEMVEDDEAPPGSPARHRRASVRKTSIQHPVEAMWN